MRITEPYTLFKRTLNSGRIVYYYQFRTESGKRTTAHTTGCNTIAKARRYVQHLYITGQLKSHSKETFENFASGFFDYDGELAEWRKLSGNPIMENTLKTYQAILIHRLIPYFKDYKICDISTDDVKKWILWASEKWSPKSVNSSQNVLSMIFNNAIEKNLIEKNPCANIGVRSIERKVRELLTVEEIKQIYNYEWDNQAGRRVFLIACLTGMRVGEILALQKENVKDGYFDVKHSWNGRFGLTPTKTKKNRYVPFPKEINLESESNWIIYSQKDDRPLTQGMVHRKFVKVCNALKIDVKSRNLNVHTLRNFFISYMKGKNVPEIKVKATVGHTDSTITDWYTYWKPEMLKEVYDVQNELYHLIID